MISMIINALVMNEVSNIMGAMGIHNDEAACNIAKCLIEYAIAPTQEEKKAAIQRYFETAGMKGWRGEAMANAVKQSLDQMPMPTSIIDFLDYAEEQSDNLNGLMSALLPYEEAEADDEEDDDDLPSQQQVIESRQVAQPRDSRGRFMPKPKQPQQPNDYIGFHGID